MPFFEGRLPSRPFQYSETRHFGKRGKAGPFSPAAQKCQRYLLAWKTHKLRRRGFKGPGPRPGKKRPCRISTITGSQLFSLDRSLGQVTSARKQAAHWVQVRDSSILCGAPFAAGEREAERKPKFEGCPTNPEQARAQTAKGRGEGRNPDRTCQLYGHVQIRDRLYSENPTSKWEIQKMPIRI